MATNRGGGDAQIGFQRNFVKTVSSRTGKARQQCLTTSVRTLTSGCRGKIEKFQKVKGSINHSVPMFQSQCEKHHREPAARQTRNDNGSRVRCRYYCCCIALVPVPRLILCPPTLLEGVWVVVTAGGRPSRPHEKIEWRTSTALFLLVHQQYSSTSSLLYTVMCAAVQYTAVVYTAVYQQQQRQQDSLFL